MVPTRKEDLRKLVTETTVDVYEGTDASADPADREDPP